MTRSVRNFWLDASVDGRSSDIGTGPRAKTDGMSMMVKIRDQGDILDAFSIRCYVDGDKLIAKCYNKVTGESMKVETYRDTPKCSHEGCKKTAEYELSSSGEPVCRDHVFNCGEITEERIRTAITNKGIKEI